MKNIRLIMSSVLTVAALTVVTSQAASAQAFGGHAVNWGNVTIPGQPCEVKGSRRPRHGESRQRIRRPARRANVPGASHLGKPEPSRAERRIDVDQAARGHHQVVP